MKKLYATFAACLIMAALIPAAQSLAVHPAVHPLGPHFLYMFAHANVCHWAVNSWALLVLHNVIKWHRLIAAYLLAVSISFIPHLSSICDAASVDRPVLGASVVTTFFFGLITPYYWQRNRTAVYMMLALIIISCLLPGFAALFHVIPFITGFLFIHIERTVRSFIAFTRD